MPLGPKSTNVTAGGSNLGWHPAATKRTTLCRITQKEGEMKFKFKLGDIVQSKVLVGMKLQVIQQQVRSNTSGHYGNWYWCRKPNLDMDTFAECELESWKEL